jgi:hypothetical protein
MYCSVYSEDMGKKTLAGGWNKSGGFRGWGGFSSVDRQAGGIENAQERWLSIFS